MRNAPDTEFKVHSLLLEYCFPEHFTSIPFYFVVYSIYTRACTVVTHPFASVAYRDNRNLIPFLVLITRILYHFIQFGRHASQASSDCLKCHKCLLSHSPCPKALAGGYVKYGNLRVHFGVGRAAG